MYVMNMGIEQCKINTQWENGQAGTYEEAFMYIMN